VVRTLHAPSQMNVKRSNALLQVVQHTLKKSAQHAITRASARQALSTPPVESTAPKPTTLLALLTQPVALLTNAHKLPVTHQDVQQSLAHHPLTVAILEPVTHHALIILALDLTAHRPTVLSVPVTLVA